MSAHSHNLATIHLTGDAHLLLTAPFFPSTDPLDYRPLCTVPAQGAIDVSNRLVHCSRSIAPLMQGSLTYGDPTIDVVMHFAGTQAFTDELAATVHQITGLSVTCIVTGMLFPDGYGAVAIKIKIPDGWEAKKRNTLIDTFGPNGRDHLGGAVREALLPALSELSKRCCEQANDDIVFPYFNLTYVGTTTHQQAGRATLADNLRILLYPRSPDPIKSDSPWMDEFFHAGYAFSLLASTSPHRTLEQLELLLMHLDVLYARMDRTASAADRSIRESSKDEDVDWLIGLERRLRADYQALVRPTFSYNYHVLKLRDALLAAWETDKTRERTDTLLAMARQAVERQLAEDQARRVSHVNLIVVILTIVSVISSADAAVDLWRIFFG